MKIDIDDILFFVGFGLLTIGLWLFNPAVSLSVSGVILMYVSYRRAGGD